MNDIGEEEFPKKYLDDKYFVRVGTDGLPQLLRVSPMLLHNSELVYHQVLLYIDEVGPTVLDRMACDHLLETSNCEPLEDVAHYKHQLEN